MEPRLCDVSDKKKRDSKFANIKKQKKHQKRKTKTSLKLNKPGLYWGRGGRVDKSPPRVREVRGSNPALGISFSRKRNLISQKSYVTPANRVNQLRLAKNSWMDGHASRPVRKCACLANSQINNAGVIAG